jgi:uncharacterized protein
MTQPAKAQEPSMEEILASIRRIIADDESKPATQVAPEPVKPTPAPAPAAKAAPPPRPAPQPAPPPPAAKNSQEDIDAMLAGFDAEVASPAPIPPEPAADIFELTEQMAVPEPPAPPRQEKPPRTFKQVEPPDDIEFSEPRPTPRSYQTPTIEPPSFSQSDAPPARPLMSANTMASVESAFNSLANTVLSQNARTLEDLVKEMLRPMLKAWIDDNLPNMVERIVRAEIERVSRGGH